MRRTAALLALLATACATREPRYHRPDPAIPASWPAGDPYVVTAESGLPALTYKQVFQDSRLQTLISQGIANNRNLMTAAANIAAAREQFRIQRAQQFPRLDAGTSVTVTGEWDNTASADYRAGFSVPNFDVDLFGRLRSLNHVQLERYFATEAGARATRLALVADIASAWLNYAADSGLLLIAQETVTSAEKSVRPTRARPEGGIAPRTDLRQAEQILSQAQADLAQQRTARAQDVNLLQLLVGSSVVPSLLAGSIDEAFGNIAPVQAGLDSYVLLRRPDILQAEYQLRAAHANIGTARAALIPRSTLSGSLGHASRALGRLFYTNGWQVGANASYTIFQAGAGRANVRLSEAQRKAAIATYQGTIQTAFREVSDALARRGTINDEIGARQRQRAATADTYLLTEARYNAGIDPYLNVLSAQQSYYSAQRILVQTKLPAAQNIIDTYQAIGGDALLQATPICQPLPGDSNASNAKLASQCSPI